MGRSGNGEWLGKADVGEKQAGVRKAGGLGAPAGMVIGGG